MRSIAFFHKNVVVFSFTKWKSFASLTNTKPLEILHWSLETNTNMYKWYESICSLIFNWVWVETHFLHGLLTPNGNYNWSSKEIRYALLEWTSRRVIIVKEMCYSVRYMQYSYNILTLTRKYHINNDNTN